ncbi:MAG: glutamate synthase subunit alpha, partial [Maribacter sp.]
ILHEINVPKGTKFYNTQKQQHNVDKSIEFEILEKAHPALFRKEKISLDFPIKNTDRAIGAIISNEISKVYGAEGLPINTIKLNFTGSAGQSFGAFATKGLTMTVNGNTNDYLGKGLSGAKLVIKVPEGSTIVPEKNVITGNVTLYGATAGRAYINGKAGERFCVRNSGAKTVVEGIGDHGCEYMTGGVAVILGEVGRNFGAGMSGGIAYVYDKNKTFKNNCNTEALNLLAVDEDEDINQLRELIESHYNYTMSPLAQRILEHWQECLKDFVKVFPEEYKQALIRLEREKLQTI